MRAEATIVDRHSNHFSDSKVDQPESALTESSSKTEMQQQEIQVEKVEFFATVNYQCCSVY